MRHKQPSSWSKFKATWPVVPASALAGKLFCLEELMNPVVKIITLAVCLNLILATRSFAGPPFLTDDPEPTDYQHWENHLFATGIHEGGAYIINGPAVEINYGILPDTQLSLSVPLTTVGGTLHRWRRKHALVFCVWLDLVISSQPRRPGGGSV
jgi:hypothetical protein